MNMKHTKQISKKIVAMLLFFILCTVSISQTAEAGSFTTKDVEFLFTNVRTEEQKTIIKDNLYVYLQNEARRVNLTDENLKIKTSGGQAGCYYIAFDDIPLDEIVILYNSDDMKLLISSHEDGAQYMYKVWGAELYVEDNLIDTIYAYGYAITIPYDETDPVLQKDGEEFLGWYTESGVLMQSGRVDPIYETNGIVKLHARWTTTTTPTHVHDWSDEWSSDDYAHWHECEGTGVCNITSNSSKNGYALHDYTGRTEVLSEPTCEDKGITRIYCSQQGCPVHKDIEVDELGHLEDTEWSNDNNKHWHECERDNCNDKLDESIHSMGEWVTVDEPTFSERGSKKRVCGGCGYTETQELPALGEGHQHDFNGTVETVSEATCTQAGLKKIHCTHGDCTEYIEERIAPLGHLCEEEWTYDAENHYKVCTRCTAKEMKQAHTFGEWECVREATAESEGLEKCICTICGYEKNRNLTYVEEPKIETPSEEDPVQTADTTYVEIYATMAMIAGFAYLLEMFKENIFGMTEKQKDDIVGRLIKWGKSKGHIRRGIALVLIVGVLLYYHAIGKKISKNVWQLAKEECNP